MKKEPTGLELHTFIVGISHQSKISGHVRSWAKIKMYTRKKIEAVVLAKSCHIFHHYNTRDWLMFSPEFCSLLELMVCPSFYTVIHVLYVRMKSSNWQAMWTWSRWFIDWLQTNRFCYILIRKLTKNVDKFFKHNIKFEEEMHESKQSYVEISQFQ